MLKSLVIDNYALISHLELEFAPGLTIITGETGAGKSIILGALSLVMGGRADTRYISDGTTKSVVDALFENVDPDLRPLFEEKGIDWIDDGGAPSISVRREISASGRSRVFVNDQPVTLQTLTAIAPRLIDIHSQHANIRISDPTERLHILDTLSDNATLRTEYQQLFNDYVETIHEIKVRRDARTRAAKNIDFLRFRLSQLNTLSPSKGELAEIERRFEALSDANDIKERLAALSSLLGDNPAGMQSILPQAAALADKINFAILDPKLTADASASIPQRLRNLLSECRDIYETIDDLNASLDTDPASLERLSARMNLYYEQIRQFNVASADELVDLYEDLKRQVAVADDSDDQLPMLESKAHALAADLKRLAADLSESRRHGAECLQDKICELARPLGLPNINFKVEVASRKLCPSGQDEVKFLCSFNKNGQLMPIDAVASGGELARTMLSLKAILARYVNLPTIIFDEVDTGVSGEIADKMGKMMHDMASNMQVMAITHLPQVAAKGDAHFKVFKRDEDARTITMVTPLSPEMRVREIAAMISGSEVSEQAISAAKALLTNNF